MTPFVVFCRNLLYFINILIVNGLFKIKRLSLINKGTGQLMSNNIKYDICIIIYDIYNVLHCSGSLTKYRANKKRRSYTFDRAKNNYEISNVFENLCYIMFLSVLKFSVSRVYIKVTLTRSICIKLPAPCVLNLVPKLFSSLHPKFNQSSFRVQIA